MTPNGMQDVYDSMDTVGPPVHLLMSERADIKYDGFRYNEYGAYLYRDGELIEWWPTDL